MMHRDVRSIWGRPTFTLLCNIRLLRFLLLLLLLILLLVLRLLSSPLLLPPSHPLSSPPPHPHPPPHPPLFLFPPSSSPPLSSPRLPHHPSSSLPPTTLQNNVPSQFFVYAEQATLAFVVLDRFRVGQHRPSQSKPLHSDLKSKWRSSNTAHRMIKPRR